MKRYRFTVLTVCLFLLFLGWNDLSLFFRNRTPKLVAIETLKKRGALREWLYVQGGYQDLEQAISTSGTVELDALLVPLKSAPEAPTFRVLVETRNPHLLELFRTYHFKIDSVFEKEAFLEKHRQEFHGRRDVSGMVVGGLIAAGNRSKLEKLTGELRGVDPEQAIFLSEAKEPPRLRGFFYAGIGLFGLIAVIRRWKTSAPGRGPAA